MKNFDQYRAFVSHPFMTLQYFDLAEKEKKKLILSLRAEIALLLFVSLF